MADTLTTIIMRNIVGKAADGSEPSQRRVEVHDPRETVERRTEELLQKLLYEGAALDAPKQEKKMSERQKKTYSLDEFINKQR